MNPKRKNVLFLGCSAFMVCVTLLGLSHLEKGIAAEALSEAKAYYIVREGDTLWWITDHFYEDPYLWPAVWGNNPYISNPHWIYPGDPIYLASIAGTYVADVAPQPEVAEPLPSAVPEVSTLRVSRRIADTALLTAEEINKTGWILAARQDKILLSQGDEVCLQLSKPPGDSEPTPYQIMRGLREIKHPVTGKKVGTLYTILGYTKVMTGTREQVAWGRILASQDAIEAGDVLRKGMPPVKEVHSKPAKRDLQGCVLAGLRSDDLIAQYDVCFIDQGIKHGVEVGDTFWVMDPVREVKDVQGRGKRTLPGTRIAMLVVIHAEKETSTALVTDGQGSFDVGYQVRARTE